MPSAAAMGIEVQRFEQRRSWRSIFQTEYGCGECLFLLAKFFIGTSSIVDAMYE